MLLDYFTVAFVVLKLCGVIHWNWFLVVTPFLVKFLIMCIADK